MREVQKSLQQSAKRLIEAKLAEHRLGEADGFKVFRDVIETPGDGIVAFQGMQDHTAESVKSFEGFKRAWSEEAQSLSSTSLSLLRPTIRAPGSQLWFSWNPRRKGDPVDVMLRGPALPTGAVVVRANWSDNPWFPAELEQERRDCLRMEPDHYAHIWEGGYVQPSPWLAISNKNVELMHKFMCELGLSPVSRSRVSTSRSLGPKPWEFD